MSELLTPAEVARRLKVSRRKVYDLLSSGQIRTVRIGSGPKPPLRVRSTDLDTYIDAGGSAPIEAGEAGAIVTKKPRGPRRSKTTAATNPKAEVLS